LPGLQACPSRFTTVLPFPPRDLVRYVGFLLPFAHHPRYTSLQAVDQSLCLILGDGFSFFVNINDNLLFKRKFVFLPLRPPSVATPLILFRFQSYFRTILSAALHPSVQRKALNPFSPLHSVCSPKKISYFQMRGPSWRYLPSSRFLLSDPNSSSRPPLSLVTPDTPHFRLIISLFAFAALSSSRAHTIRRVI